MISQGTLLRNLYMFRNQEISPKSYAANSITNHLYYTVNKLHVKLQLLQWIILGLTIKGIYLYM